MQIIYIFTIASKHEFNYIVNWFSLAPYIALISVHVLSACKLLQSHYNFVITSISLKIHKEILLLYIKLTIFTLNTRVNQAITLKSVLLTILVNI